MSEPTRDYGFITAITPEEIKALGNIKAHDQIWIAAGGWGGDQREDLKVSHWSPIGAPVRRPIDPDPSMPAGKKRWEIVPWHEEVSRQTNMFTQDGENWRWFNNLWDGLRVDFICTHNFSILAFRRPTALKEAGAGSSHLKNLPTSEAFVETITALQSELTQLRTLAKDQGEALGEAQNTMDKVIKRWIWLVNNPRAPLAGMASMDAAVEECQSTLTLIAKLKEVGE